MKEKRIEFETAKLANSKGFDIETYELDYMVDGNYPGKQGACVSCTTYIKCSTQSLLQKWLRDIHNIFIDVNINYYSAIFQNKDFYMVTDYCNSYEEALEVGLQEALKLINDEK